MPKVASHTVVLLTITGESQGSLRAPTIRPRSGHRCPPGPSSSSTYLFAAFSISTFPQSFEPRLIFAPENPQLLKLLGGISHEVGNTTLRT